MDPDKYLAYMAEHGDDGYEISAGASRERLPDLTVGDVRRSMAHLPDSARVMSEWITTTPETQIDLGFSIEGDPQLGDYLNIKVTLLRVDHAEEV